MLSAIESSATQSLHLTLTRQLAVVLLRGVSGIVYSCPGRVTETIALWDTGRISIARKDYTASTYK
jgi:hypothetical protein